MRDPFYARIMFKIEKQIHEFDRKTKEMEGVEVKDSDVKSAIRKALGMLRQTRPLRRPKDRDDRLKGALAIELAGVLGLLAEKENVARPEYVNALRAVEDSLVLRRETGGHSRGYLEYLEGFIAKAKGE